MCIRDSRGQDLPDEETASPRPFWHTLAARFESQTDAHSARPLSRGDKRSVGRCGPARLLAGLASFPPVPTPCGDSIWVRPSTRAEERVAGERDGWGDAMLAAAAGGAVQRGPDTVVLRYLRVPTCAQAAPLFLSSVSLQPTHRPPNAAQALVSLPHTVGHITKHHPPRSVTAVEVRQEEPETARR